MRMPNGLYVCSRCWREYQTRWCEHCGIPLDDTPIEGTEVLAHQIGSDGIDPVKIKDALDEIFQGMEEKEKEGKI